MIELCYDITKPFNMKVYSYSGKGRRETNEDYIKSEPITNNSIDVFEVISKKDFEIDEELKKLENSNEDNFSIVKVSV